MNSRTDIVQSNCVPLLRYTAHAHKTFISNALTLQLLGYDCALEEDCSTVNDVPLSQGCFSTDSAVGRSRHSGFSIACKQHEVEVPFLP